MATTSFVSVRRATVTVLLLCAAAWAADPAFYRQKATWQETMLASREALAAIEQARIQNATYPVDKEAVTFKGVAVEGAAARKAGQRVRVRVRGLKYLWLSHSGGDAKDAMIGCWGDPMLTTRDKKQVRLSDLKPIVSSGLVDAAADLLDAAAGAKKKAVKARGRTSKKNRQPRLRMGKQQLTFGLRVSGQGELCYRLDGNYEMFDAYVGAISSKNRKATMIFRVDRLPGRESIRRDKDRGRIEELVERDFAATKRIEEIQRERVARIWEHDWSPGDGRDVAKRYASALRGTSLAAEANTLAAKAKSPADVLAVCRLFHRQRAAAEHLALAGSVNLKALRLAVEDLMRTFGAKYPKGAEYLKRLAELEKTDVSALAKSGGADVAKAAKLAGELVTLQRDALLDNPLLDPGVMPGLLLIKRRGGLALPQNWQGNCAMRRSGYDDELMTLSPVRPGGKLTTLYRPKRDVFVGDVELHYDADRLLFSSIAESGRWQVFEMGTGGKGLRQVTKGRITEVDNYDPCYLPDGRIIFASAAVMTGVPCVGGKTPVSNLYIMDADGGNVRQLCFDQDHNWCPVVANDGRVMYTRWEYSDTPHYFSRILFHMNPDGTQQMALYGSNSYWPNSLFYARPVPNHPTKVIAVISGHHGVPRMGELILFDPAQGRHEADGVVQRIPGYGKPVKPIIADRLVNNSWPKFLHPYPLSEKYFLVSCQLNSKSTWSICLVDVFDNILPIVDLPGCMLCEPIPLRKTRRPPIIPDKVDLRKKDALVYMTDVYAGPGLRGIPRGAVKKLRVIEWHFAYQRMGGHASLGVESGWDVKRVLGTVPVEPDGSALFSVPANTPLAVQPLDENGRALQLMRSWLTAMPGEVLSCVGCHEQQTDGSPNLRTMAGGRRPSKIQPWRGPARGFSFPREVQPVLSKYCAGCHNGQPRKDGAGQRIPNFADGGKGYRGFTGSYLALHPYVRRPGPESDYHILHPAEYHVNTSELIQMLRRGHHNVQLDEEAWDRLCTWIDLNVPDHGTWQEHAGSDRTSEQKRLRAEYRKLYANIDVDPEAVPQTKPLAVTPVVPKPRKLPPVQKVTATGWPFDAAEARKRQAAAGKAARTVDLGNGVKMDFVLVPAGELVMGDPAGGADERPLTRVRIDGPFWMGRTEVTNSQYRRFAPMHNSRVIDQHHKDHATPGYEANRPNQPAVRISWREAMAFCRWLAKKTGPGAPGFTLPTEAQWEYACRAGTATPFGFGPADSDFSKFANMADLSVRLLSVSGVNPKPIKNPNPQQDFIPKDERFDDGQKIVADVGKYQPNAWGLHDMHGNVAEWTLSVFKPYPYRDGDGRNTADAAGERVVRGGSWRDRPRRCTATFRLSYPSWQGVYNVGFRVVCPVGKGWAVAVGSKAAG